MKKLAICFLVTKNIVNLDAWEKWWAGRENMVSVYAHFSQIGPITQPILLNNRVDPVPTRWGDVSLVLAEGQLYKKAIQDKDNVFFVLVSDTCVPVRSFDYIYSRLLADRKRGMLGYRLIGSHRYTTEPFIKDGDCDGLLRKNNFYQQKVYAADQWKILSRSNVRDFIRMLNDPGFNRLFTECINIVPDSLAPDELMYVNWMMKKTKAKLYTKFRAFGPTFVDFNDKAIHPFNYRQITKRLADNICYSNTFFARKFPDPMHDKLLKQLPVECYKRDSLLRGEYSGSSDVSVKEAKKMVRSRRRKRYNRVKKAK